MEILVIMLTGFVLYILEGIFYSRIWSRGLNADIKITPTTAFKGDKCTLELIISNRKLLPLPWLWVKLHISSGLQFQDMPNPKDEYIYRNFLFCIMGWQEIKRKMYFTCLKRGYYPLKSFEVIGTSILFNGKHSKSFGSPCALTVYPSLVENTEIDSLLSRLALDNSIAYKGFINPDPFEFSGIRQYSSTDSLKDINFKASAHNNTLMSNTHNPTIKGDITIILCFKLLKQSFEEERFEYAISLGATLADYYINKGFSVSLISNGKQASDESIGTSIEGGNGISHLHNIFETLARICYSRNKTDSINTLKPQGSCSSNAIFISPTVDMDILELYRSVEESYFSTSWLFPVMEFDVPRTTPPTATARIVAVPPIARS